MADRALREQLARVLTWRDAHVTLEDALAGLPPGQRGQVPAGFAWSLWQLLEHLRLSQADILSFCRDRQYHEQTWPDDYWPADPAPPRSGAWSRSVTAFRRDRAALVAIARNARIDLLAVVPNGTTQTWLRELLLAADHAAYHVGQIVAVRRALGSWPPARRTARG